MTCAVSAWAPLGVLSAGRVAFCPRLGATGDDGGGADGGARPDAISGEAIAPRCSPSGSATSPPPITPITLGGVACSGAVAPVGGVITARAAELSRQAAMIRCQPGLAMTTPEITPSPVATTPIAAAISRRLAGGGLCRGRPTRSEPMAARGQSRGRTQPHSSQNLAPGPFWRWH